MKKKIIFFGPMDQKLWVFEVSRRSLGRAGPAGMCWSQPVRVDHLHKKWRARRKKNSRKMGTARQAEASTRQPQVEASAYRAIPSFLKFFYLKKI
jgi:hypothetical protein